MDGFGIEQRITYKHRDEYMAAIPKDWIPKLTSLECRAIKGDDDVLTLLYLETHENFYRDLKKKK